MTIQPGSSPDTQFDIDDPQLPQWIAQKAFMSGNYPYDKKLKWKKYEKQLIRLQTELLKLQISCRARGERIVILFEGRDAAGKGGTIKRFMQHLNPRHARVVALSKPTESERGQWYFQRYISHLPTSGDMTLFDRSWYNRAGVERVMGFCNRQQLDLFLKEVPLFESSLVRDGIKFYKFWLTIGQEMQLKRFHDRKHDPLRHWKLSDIDLKSIGLWHEYSAARDDLFASSHLEETPWTIIRSNDKRRARLNAMRVLLTSLDYDNKDVDAIGEIDKNIVGNDVDFIKNA